MARDTVLDSLRMAYIDEIHEAMVECSHYDTGDFDLPRLSRALHLLMKEAEGDGLSPRVFSELVRQALPEFWKYVDYLEIA